MKSSVEALYDPFEAPDFSSNRCFLTGTQAEEFIPVFPAWLQARFGLSDKPFKMLDEQLLTFGSLKLPVSGPVRYQLDLLEGKLEQAFAGGYHTIASLDEKLLFQWFSKILYGLVYAELQLAFAALDETSDEESLGVSPSLIARFRNLHQLLQSVVLPVEFDLISWSLSVHRLNDPAYAANTDTLDYRDDMSTMVFSVAFADVAVIAVLHDLGKNCLYQQRLTDHLAGAELNFLQFRELAARFFYSAYLFKPIPRYHILPPTDAQPFYNVASEPLGAASSTFRSWDNKMYAQVLEAFWKPWAVTCRENLPLAVPSALYDANGRVPVNPTTDSLYPVTQ